MTTDRPELIWLRPERSARGPAPAHSRSVIAAAAIALADADGLAAVSMRKIAASLGAGTMSLYNYVPAKEHLFDLMLDAVAGEWKLPDAPSGDARVDLLGFAKEGLAAMRRRPWVPALVLTRPTIGPNSLRCVEYFLRVMADNEQPSDTKMELFAMLNGSICMYAQWEANQSQTGGTEQWQTELVTYLAQAAATGEYPHLAATFAASAGRAPDLDPDVLFARAIDRVISIVLGP